MAIWQSGNLKLLGNFGNSSEFQRQWMLSVSSVSVDLVELIAPRLVRSNFTKDHDWMLNRRPCLVLWIKRRVSRVWLMVAKRWSGSVLLVGSSTTSPMLTAGTAKPFARFPVTVIQPRRLLG